MQTDLERRVIWARRGAPTRESLAALWRRQQPPANTAADCLKACQEPRRRLEPLRRRTAKA
ncbi:hypothetical protein ACLF3G_15530 [Falsiroseomonas sp. HC035]|uniref:hypothetical protein n=1 Tax=Falsiroseomonas sp. HC035 TaxID=3390999 RepID=UPI003D31999E